MKITGLSASSYSLYTWCEWKWFLQYVARLEDPGSPATLAGHIAHKALEILSIDNIAKKSNDIETLTAECIELSKDFDMSKSGDPEYIWDMCVEYYQRIEQDIWDKMPAKKIKDIKIGYDWLCDLKHEYNPTTANTISAEFDFKIPMDGPQWVTKVNNDGSFDYFKLRGRIDRIDMNNGQLEVIDYKSGSLMSWPPKKNNKDKELQDFYDDIQCLMYYYAVKHRFPDIASVSVTFIYIKEKKIFTVALCEHDAKRLKEKIFKRYVKIKDNNDPAMNQGWWCSKICHFGKTGECKQVWREKEKVGMDFVADLYSTKREISDGK